MKRYVTYGLLIVLVVGAILCYQLYQNRQANLRAAESFQRQAEMDREDAGKVSIGLLVLAAILAGFALIVLPRM